MATRSRRSRMLAACALPMVLVAVGAVVVPAASSAQTGRVTVTPSSLELDPDQSQVVQFELDEPIIAPPPDPGFVTVTLTASDPDRVGLSSTSVTWSAADWQQTREVTVTALPDAPPGTDTAVTVSGVVTSNSEYYSGYSLSFEVTVSGAEPEAEPEAPRATTTTGSTTPVTPVPSAPPEATEPRSTAGADLAITG